MSLCALYVCRSTCTKPSVYFNKYEQHPPSKKQREVCMRYTLKSFNIGAILPTPTHEAAVSHSDPPPSLSPKIRSINFSLHLIWYLGTTYKYLLYTIYQSCKNRCSKLFFRVFLTDAILIIGRVRGGAVTFIRTHGQQHFKFKAFSTLRVKFL